MLGDMSDLLGDFSEDFTLTQETGSLVKGQWTKGTPKQFNLSGVFIDLSPSAYTFYEGIKINSDAKILFLMETIKAIKVGGQIEETVVLKQDDKIVFKGCTYLITGILPLSNNVNIVKYIIEKEVLQ